MTIPLLILAFLSVFGGFINLPTLMAGSYGQKLAGWYNHIFSLKTIPTHESHLSHSMEWTLMGIAVMLVLILGWFAFNRFKKSETETANRTGFSLWGENKFYVDEFYHWLVVKPFENISDQLFYFVETKLIQPIFFGSSRFLFSVGQILRILQNGNVEYYLVYITVGVLSLLTILIFIL
jgi:NADH-quinone oxidoreductase subunit L